MKKIDMALIHLKMIGLYAGMMSALPVFLKIYEITEKQVYREALSYNISYWTSNITKTRGGLCYLNKIGVLRYAAAESLIAMQWYELTGDSKFKIFAKSQIDYILGANPDKISYVVGVGKKYLQNVLHRAAYGYDSFSVDFEKNSFKKPK